MVNLILCYWSSLIPHCLSVLLVRLLVILGLERQLIVVYLVNLVPRVCYFPNMPYIFYELVGLRSKNTQAQRGNCKLETKLWFAIIYSFITFLFVSHLFLSLTPSFSSCHFVISLICFLNGQ